MSSYKKVDQPTAKVLAFDIGDQWTGSALSDPLGFTAKPYKTVATKDLEAFIANTMQEEQIKEVIVGYPITLRGTKSEQTKKIVAKKEKLEKTFPILSWQLWDERLTSKRASFLKKAKTKEEKLHAHSIAAAFILQSYLDYCFTQKTI